MSAGFLMKSGMILPVVGDRLLNETNAGRAVRDGGDVLYGLQQDIEEFTESVKQNVESFDEDVRNFIPTKPFVQLGENNIRFWDKFWKGDYGILEKLKEAEEYAEEHKEDIPELPKSEPSADWVYGDDWTIDEIMDDLSEKMDKMTEATEDMTGASKEQTSTTDDMNKAVETMESMPEQLGKEMGLYLRNALEGIGITIDGDILVGYVNNRQATEVGP